MVVVVDLDPQGSLTRALLYDRCEGMNQIRLQEAFEEKRTFGASVRDRLLGAPKEAGKYLTHGVGPIGKHYPMLANEASAWNVEREAQGTVGEEALKAAVAGVLGELAEVYRYVLVDAPPGQTVVAEAAIQISDLVLCPTSPDLLSFWGLESFNRYLREICAGEEGPPARFVFTKFKKRAPRYDPQDRVHEWVNSFAAPDYYITLLREVGNELLSAANQSTFLSIPSLRSGLKEPPIPANNGHGPACTRPIRSGRLCASHLPSRGSSTVDRAALLQAIEPLIEPTPTQREGLRKLLDKVLVEASVAIPLESAWRLTVTAKDELEIVILDLYAMKDAQRLSAKWEPLRTLDADLKESLRHDLIDLLRGRRAPYRGLAIVPLKEARADVAKYRAIIERSMPTKDAKKLLKAWDKNLKPLPTARTQIVGHLLKLLERAGKQAA